MADLRAPLDIGHGHTVRFTRWTPDRQLNPQYADLPDTDPIGLLNDHLKPDGTPCPGGAVMFDGEVARHVFPGGSVWQLVSLDPLTLSPSLLCPACGDHGFIREGRWIPA